jgi:hypothetical protein
MEAAADPPAPPGSQPAEREREWPFFIGCALAGLAGVGALVFVILFVFWFGEDVTGSSRSVIDDYNRRALDATQLPADATLVQSRVYEETDADGRVIRYLARLYVTSLPYEEVRDHFRTQPAPRFGGVTVEFLPPGPAGRSKAHPRRWPAPMPIRETVSS